ncbi:MAG: hypothetical protein U1E53_20470 [Dongiaceae bacterium]
MPDRHPPRRPGAALRRAAAALAVLALGWLPAAAAPPMDPAGFTAAVAEGFRRALPAARVTVSGPLLLSLELSTAPIGIELEPLLQRCRQDLPACDGAVEDYVRRMAATASEAAAPIRPEQLRVVVRSAAQVAEARRLAGGVDVAQPVARPLAGDLWLLCVVDHPLGIETLTSGEAAKLGLGEAAAIALAERNVAAALPPAAVALPDPPRHGVVVLSGDFYASSRLLLHEQWAPLSRRLKGRLVVAAAGIDRLVYGEGGDRAALAAIAARAAAEAQRPDPPTLLRWRPDGWDVVAP